MDCFVAALLAMTVRVPDSIFKHPNTTSRSRGTKCPSFAGTFPPSKSEGAGNAGCALHPRSRVRWVEESAHEHTGQRRTSDIPCAMALRLTSCSPRRTALLPPLRPKKQLPPGALTPAPRRQDHTTSPYASAASSLQHPRPPHPTARFVTCATPLWSGGTGRPYSDFYF